MILTPDNDPFFFVTLATPIPSPNLPASMISPTSMAFKLGETVAIPMGLDETIEYIFGGELDAKELEIGGDE